MINVYLEVAFETPYLLYEVLAYSAAHLSTLRQEQHRFYVDEATRLQTRALELYNGVDRKVSEETCIPMFCFSSVLSQHTFFDIYSHPTTDLDKLVDDVISSMRIHLGLRAMLKSSWLMFPKKLQSQFITGCERNSGLSAANTGRECDSLLKRIEAADLSTSSITTLCEAVEILQKRFDEIDMGGYHAPWTAGQDWLALVPSEYINLLGKRLPEALVILAHFAIILHRSAEHWFVGDVGKRLILLISDRLGPSYSEWLEWPNMEITHKR
ncbi:hypothetical protein BX600DRAFT_474880 [Xylariales sp. PMI_506]|nr:hypothetical protein BX600DRAFT_474880 [Xylariales sp. PMI_506]